MSFEPKMVSKSRLEHNLKRLAATATRELYERYPGQKAGPVQKALNELLDTVDYSTYQKSIALFVSAGVQKIYYLGLELEDTVHTGEPFNIRSVLHHRKASQKFLLLQLEERSAQVFVQTPSGLRRLLSDQLREPLLHEAGDAATHLREQFLRRVDNSLSILMDSCPLPLVLLGPPAVVAQFRSLSRNGDHEAHIIQQDTGIPVKNIELLLEPVLEHWEELKLDYLLHQLELAQQKGRLAEGIENVWKAASEKRGQLLVMEENYTHAFARHTVKENGKEEEEEAFLKDAVDMIVAKVLENNAKVELVPEGSLKDHLRIAMILDQ